jgi:HD-GYP domain-containing protein (c-di-GMP phosphodiesterase class II)
VLENREYQVRLEQKVDREAGQARKYYLDAMEALAREDKALRKLSALSDGNKDGGFEELYTKIARILAQMDEMHEPYARGHADRVSLLTGEIAQQLGCSEDVIRDIQLGSVLHDIGKIVIPDHILFKPGTLTAAEYSEVKRHPTAAVDIISHVDRFANLIPIVECHHEWYNGKGYPKKLKNEDIPLGARIISVADCYDAMTCPRPYRPRLSDEEAVKALRKGAGTQWDPAVVDAFLKVLKREAKMLENSLVQT